MTPFEPLCSVAAPMPDEDIDTDIIFPARYLLLTQKQGLGAYAFRDLRFDAQGRERTDFVLHRVPWRGAQILVAGRNFGCGSSREQAPWALADLGLRCLIAPSFGEIFRSNCLHNGLLPIAVPPADHERLLKTAQAGETMAIDLQSQAIVLHDGTRIAFDIGERAREALLKGWDEIDRILHDEGAHIAAFEHRQRIAQPWLYLPPAASS
jgi:3-isopropylmalate/(R)-2-methylmalate dehydratase small subunit